MKNIANPALGHAVTTQKSSTAPTVMNARPSLTRAGIRAIAAAPGYLIAAATIDRIGRKSIQMVGFVMMAVTFGAMAFIPDVEKLLLPFLIIYGVSYFFTEFGPNSTTFVYPAEIFPVRARTTGHGIAAATGKLGGFFGVFLLPDSHGVERPDGGGGRGGHRQRARRDRHPDDAARDQGPEP